MINKLKLHNFKSYKDQEFNFGKLTVFCGNNSVGKSTAIQSISIPFQSKFDWSVALNGDLTELGSLEDIHHNNATDDELCIELHIDDFTTSWGYRQLDEQEQKFPKHLNTLQRHDTGDNERLRFLLDNFQCLQAERYGPKSNYELAKGDLFHSNWLGPKGEFTSELISHAIANSRLNIGQIADKEEALSDHRSHDSSESPLLYRQIEAWMREISPGISVTSKVFKEASAAINVFSQNDVKSIKPHNVGFGVSYALSIVTALLHTQKDGLVLIENPEAHLHPRGQSYLGRLIQKTAEAGVQVIIETHSDHLLNGIRVAARLSETYKNGLAKVFFISAGEKQSEVEEISIGTKGELSSWPGGFFDQQAMDVRTLMKGKEA